MLGVKLGNKCLYPFTKGYEKWLVIVVRRNLKVILNHETKSLLQALCGMNFTFPIPRFWITSRKRRQVWDKGRMCKIDDPENFE